MRNYRVRNSRRRYESDSTETYDIYEVIDYALEQMEKAFPIGEGDYDEDDPSDMCYNAEVPVCVESNYVDIESIRCDCDSRREDGKVYLRFVGSERPDPEELLDPYYHGNIICYGNDYDLFDKTVRLSGKTTEECKREIDRVMEAYIKHHKRTMQLWDEMQEALDRLDHLHDALIDLQRAFYDKMKQA